MESCSIFHIPDTVYIACYDIDVTIIQQLLIWYAQLMIAMNNGRQGADEVIISLSPGMFEWNVILIISV